MKTAIAFLCVSTLICAAYFWCLPDVPPTKTPTADQRRVEACDEYLKQLDDEEQQLQWKLKVLDEMKRQVENDPAAADTVVDETLVLPK